MDDTYAVPYTPQQIATRWGVGYQTVLSMIREGKLHGFRAGREWRVPVEALREYETRAPEPKKQKINRIN